MYLFSVYTNIKHITLISTQSSTLQAEKLQKFIMRLMLKRFFFLSTAEKFNTALPIYISHQ